MTVSGRIIEWLKKFDPKEMKHIDTDLMRGTVDYVLVKEPTVNVKRFISGAEIHKEYYQIRARLDTQTNTDCEENGAWLETLTDWIDRQNREKVFPALDGVTVQKIGVSSPFYMGKNEQNKSLYQMTIFIEYFKKGE